MTVDLPPEGGSYVFCFVFFVLFVLFVFFVAPYFRVSVFDSMKIMRLDGRIR